MYIAIVLFAVIMIIVFSYRTHKISKIRREIEKNLHRIKNVEKNNTTLTAFYVVDKITSKTIEEDFRLEEDYLHNYYTNLKTLTEFLQKSEYQMHECFMTDEERKKYAEVFEKLKEKESELKFVRKKKKDFETAKKTGNFSEIMKVMLQN